MARTGRGNTALALCVAAGIVAGAAGRAEAAFTYTVLQQGADVVATGSGSISLAALSFEYPSVGVSGVWAANGYIGVGGSGDAYSGYSGPFGFGSGDGVFASGSSGAAVILSSYENLLLVPPGYQSGDPLANTLTFANQTFATLGLTPGTYTWTWGSGSTADSFTVQIGPLATVPEPASALLIGAGLLGLVATRRRRAAA